MPTASNGHLAEKQPVICAKAPAPDDGTKGGEYGRDTKRKIPPIWQ
jgi:hypothetical protein